MQTMVFRNSRLLAIAALTVGVLLVIVSFLTEPGLSTAAGAVLTVLGVLMLINPALRIDADEVAVVNPLGMRLKRFPVSSPADIAFEGNQLVHRPTGSKILTLNFGHQREDVDRLRAQVPGAR